VVQTYHTERRSMTISISKMYSFDAAHMLWNDEWTADENREVFGKCSRLHGHTYTLDVTIEGPVDPETGMILNYFDLDKIVKPIVDGQLDHQNLNEVFMGRLTTAENMVDILSDWIDAALYEQYSDERNFYLVMVALSETPKTSAVWSR